MPWIKVDDHYDEHPKFADVGPLGMAMWLAGMAYCNRNLTDGYIPWGTARSLLTWQFLEPPDDDGRRRVATIGVTSGYAGDDVDCAYVLGLLVHVGLWEPSGDGYQVHDYHLYQPSRAEVMKERERLSKVRAVAGSKGGAKRKQTGKQSGSPVPVPVPVPNEGDSGYTTPTGFSDAREPETVGSTR